MPLVALDSDGRRIDITQVANPREALVAGLTCPLCGGEMIVVAGLVRMPHFRHKTECTSDYARHPESFEHLRTKALVAEMMGTWFGEFSTARPQLEMPIEEARRIADVLFVFPNGWRVACEVQLASITNEQLQQRTDDYLRAGVDVCWFLGKAADSITNRRWVMEQQGFVCTLEYDTEPVDRPVTGQTIAL